MENRGIIESTWGKEELEHLEEYVPGQWGWGNCILPFLRQVSLLMPLVFITALPSTLPPISHVTIFSVAISYHLTTLMFASSQEQQLHQSKQAKQVSYHKISSSLLTLATLVALPTCTNKKDSSGAALQCKPATENICILKPSPNSSLLALQHVVICATADWDTIYK